jgi:hypothetical protein
MASIETVISGGYGGKVIKKEAAGDFSVAAVSMMVSKVEALPRMNCCLQTDGLLTPGKVVGR